MLAEAATGMISNAALLLTVGIVYFLIPIDPTARTLRRKISAGLVLGLIGIALMRTNWELLPGLFFDTRSVLLVVAGMFFGPLPATAAVVLTSAYRIYLGGVGALTGVGVIVSSAGIGLLWRHYFRNRHGWLDYYLVGLAVHIVMLGWMLVMPHHVAVKTLRDIVVPVLVIYPAATMLLAKLLDLQKYWLDVRERALFNERRLQGMLVKAWGIISLLDMDSTCRYISDSVTGILGYAPEELLDRRMLLLVHPDDVANVKQKYRKMLADPGSSYEEAYRLRHKDGSWVWMETVATNLLEDRDVGSVVLHSRDITEKKKAEEDLHLARSRAQVYLDTVETMIIVLDREGRILTINAKACQVLGYEEHELLGQSWFETCLPQPDGMQIVFPFFQRLMAGGTEDYEYFENQVVTRSGEVRLIAWHNSLLRDSDGQVTNIIGNGIDITEQREAEQKLLESEYMLRESQSVAKLGSYILDVESGEWKCSEELEYLFDIGPDYPHNVEGWLGLIDPADRAEMEEYFLKTVVGKGITFDRRYRIRRHRSGDQRWVHGLGKLELDEDGRPLKMLGTIQDITEQKHVEDERAKLEAQLRQAQKIESVGRLAGGVAHDFNNMLGVILGHAEFGLMQIERDHPLHDHLQEIQHAAERSTELTRQLLAFARKQTVSPRVVNLNKTISSMLKMLQRLIGESIELTWLPGPDGWQVRIDPSQIDQILANLCVNARDAIDKVGMITIETNNVSFDQQFCEEHVGYLPGEFVLLAVGDNGRGMDPETREKIFEPFFSTKAQGEGTGLGLAMVHGIVAQNGGFINLYSEPGKGTMFKIYLPRYVGAAKPSAEESPVAALQDVGRETILLVEDEEAMLNLTTSILEDLGYSVIPANTPGEAIEKARQHRGNIDLLITDVVMPEMNGRDLAKNVLSLFPDIKRLFISGYTADVIAHHGVLDEGVNFLQKPYSRQDLSRKVRDVIDLSSAS